MVLNLSKESVKTQLEKILASPEFEDRDRLKQFLDYVVTQSLNGHSNSIKQYTVAVEGLGYKADFDPQTNPTIRVHARQLRRALEKYYLTEGRTDPVLINVPKGSYVPEIKPNHDNSNELDSSTCPSSASALTPFDPSEPIIALVMFDSISKEDEDLVIARGLTAELLSTLARFSGVTVLGPLTHAGRNKPGSYSSNGELGARFVLHGSVRSFGTSVRITPDLTDASTGKILWSQTFEYDLEKTSLFEIEDAVSGKVAGTIADGVGVVIKKLKNETYPNHIRRSDVTQAVLHYNNAWMTLAPQDWQSAVAAINQALNTQPDNALLVAMMANCYYADALFEMNIVHGAASQMTALAHEAVALDTELQVAHYNLVVVNAFFGRIKRCIAAAKRVVKMNPNYPRVLGGTATAVASVGEYELGVELIERAKLLNPHYPSWYHFVTYLDYFRKKQYESAWQEAQKIHMQGTFFHPLFRASVLGKLGQIDKAKPYLDELLTIKPDFLQRPREIIKLLFVLDSHVEMIQDGLRKAGMEV